MSLDNPERFLRDLFDVAVAAADPAKCVPAHLDGILADDHQGRIVVVGAGKASAAMARAVEEYWPDRELTGLVVTRSGCAVPCQRIEIVEAAHPVPDAAGLKAAERILEIAGDLGADDLLLCLISGGGSALLSLPGEGLALEDKQAVNTALLRSGATIGDMKIDARLARGYLPVPQCRPCHQRSSDSRWPRPAPRRQLTSGNIFKLEFSTPN